MKNICCLPCISRLVPGKVSFVTLNGSNRKGGCFGKRLDARVLYRMRVFSHASLFAHKRVKQLTALDKSFSMQNNIYRDTLCFAYYICAYLRDR